MKINIEKEEPKKFLKQNVAMIYPPPELKKIVDKVANLVIKYGEEFEEKLKNDENNKKYSFLNKDDPYFLYYSSKIKENKKNKEKQNKNIPDEFLQKKRKISNEEETKEEKENNNLNNKENQIKTPFEEVKTEINSLFSKTSLEQLTKAPEIINYANIKAPKPDQFIISHPNISELELDIIKITAQFVSKNGQKFLLDLSERESKNPQFDFLKPQHNLFGYFTYLVSSYSKILSEKNEKNNKLIDYSLHKESILKNAQSRLLYEMKIKNMKKNKKNESDLNENDKKNKAIDWYDFVVVATIDFDDDEEEEIKQENKINIKKEKEINNNNNNNNNIEKDDIKIEEISEKQKQKDENEKITKKEIDNITEPVNNIITENGMKIVKNYKRVSQNNYLSNQNEEEEIKCPLCNTSLTKDKLQEHIKLELLDPKWKEIQREIDKRAENSTLASGDEFLHNLNNFSKQRPDLFDNNNKNSEIKEEENLNQNIFSGFNPYMNRTTAIIKKFQVQNLKNVEESFIAHKNEITNNSRNINNNNK